MKPCLKDNFVKYSRYRAKARADIIKALFFCLEKEKGRDNWKKVEEIKERLKQMLLEDSMGTVIRSKTGAEAEEERSSLYHLNREHKRGRRNNVLKLKIKNRNGNEVVTEDEKEIEENVLSFFEPLFRGMHGSDLKVKKESFQQDTTYLDEYLDTLEKLTCEEKYYLLKPVDLEEIRETVKELEEGKSPGSDGLP